MSKLKGSVRITQFASAIVQMRTLRGPGEEVGAQGLVVVSGEIRAITRAPTIITGANVGSCRDSPQDHRTQSLQDYPAHCAESGTLSIRST